jgi:phage terminase large subunit-like protein
LLYESKMWFIWSKLSSARLLGAFLRVVACAIHGVNAVINHPQYGHKMAINGWYKHGINMYPRMIGLWWFMMVYGIGWIQHYINIIYFIYSGRKLTAHSALKKLHLFGQMLPVSSHRQILLSGELLWHRQWCQMGSAWSSTGDTGTFQNIPQSANIIGCTITNRSFQIVVLWFTSLARMKTASCHVQVSSCLLNILRLLSACSSIVSVLFNLYNYSFCLLKKTLWNDINTYNHNNSQFLAPVFLLDKTLSTYHHHGGSSIKQRQSFYFLHLLRGITLVMFMWLMFQITLPPSIVT